MPVPRRSRISPIVFLDNGILFRNRRRIVDRLWIVDRLIANDGFCDDIIVVRNNTILLPALISGRDGNAAVLVLSDLHVVRDDDCRTITLPGSLVNNLGKGGRGNHGEHEQEAHNA